MVDWLEIADEEDMEFRVVPLKVVVWLSITSEEGMEFKVELSKPVDVCEPREVLAWDGESVDDSSSSSSSSSSLFSISLAVAPISSKAGPISSRSDGSA